MRVLHVVRQFKPGIGGLEDYVANLARVQGEAGHTVSVLTLDRLFAEPGRKLAARERTAAYGVTRIGYGGSHRYPIVPGVFRHVRDCDLIHVHGIDFFFDALAWSKVWHGRPMVVSTHGGFFHTPYAARLKKAFFHTVTRGSLRTYNAVIACSKNDHELFSAIARQPVDLVENGIDAAKFRDCASSVFRKRMIAIGRFATHKRLDRVLDFLAELRARDPEWSLAIAGTEWDVTLDELRQWAAARGLSDCVSFHLRASDAEIAAEMDHASFIVSASEYEGFGIAAVEGLSAGLYPVLNGIPAFRRLRDKTGLGMLADFSDPRALAGEFLGAVPSIACDYARLRKKAQGAAEAYAWPAVAKKIDAIYERVRGEHERSIFGVPVCVSTRDEAVAQLDAEIDSGRTARVAFLNAHGANIARRDERFSRCLRDCLVFNDGIGVDIASYWLYGRRFPENLNGTDFTIDYLKRTHRSYRIYLLGARRRVVTQAAIRLGAKLGRHRIVGYSDGYFDRAQTPEIAGKIRASRADLLLVGFGNPDQELWIADHLEETGCRLAFAVGALFDFASGTVPRAPSWIRRCHAEWLFRLTMEPRRLWRRYVIGNASFLFHLVSGEWALSRLQTPLR